MSRIAVAGAPERGAAVGGIMETWKEDQVNALFAEQSVESRFQQAVTLAAGLGFEHCAYGIRVARSCVSPQILMFNSYPRAWQARYRHKRYLEVDPSVRHGLVSLTPYVWPTRETWGDNEEFWAEAHSHGLRAGISLPVVSINGIRGMFTVTHPFTETNPHSLERLEWLGNIVHQSMTCAVMRESVDADRLLLTGRELEVLRWVADGSTSREVAHALGIAESTVNFHLKAAITKLKVPNRTAAAVLAMRLGLIG